MGQLWTQSKICVPEAQGSARPSPAVTPTPGEAGLEEAVVAAARSLPVDPRIWPGRAHSPAKVKLSAQLFHSKTHNQHQRNLHGKGQETSWVQL